jgi:hypothetical protein
LQVAEVLKLDASEFMHRIEGDVRCGPQEPGKVHGRPRKMNKKASANAVSATK